MSDGPSIPTANFDAWYAMAGEFFRSCEGADLAQIENGHKALTLAYVGLQQDPTPVQEVKAWAIFNLAAKKVLAAEFTEELLVVDYEHDDTRLEVHRAANSIKNPTPRPERLAYKARP